MKGKAFPEWPTTATDYCEIIRAIFTEFTAQACLKEPSGQAETIRRLAILHGRPDIAKQSAPMVLLGRLAGSSRLAANPHLLDPVVIAGRSYDPYDLFEQLAREAIRKFCPEITTKNTLLAAAQFLDWAAASGQDAIVRVKYTSMLCSLCPFGVGLSRFQQDRKRPCTRPEMQCGILDVSGSRHCYMILLGHWTMSEFFDNVQKQGGVEILEIIRQNIDH